MFDRNLIKENIAKNIVKYRTSANLSQKEFAKKLGVGASRVSNWENGTNSMDINMLLQICDALDVSINDMCGIYPDLKVTLDFSEQEHIKKYLNLDSFGRQTVDLVLDREVTRVKELNNMKERIEELETIPPSTVIDMKPRLENNTRFIEYHRSASAGTGVFILGNEGVDQLPIPDTPENRKVDYAIKVSGNSMEPDYYDGDIVLVSQKVELNHGDVGIFIINNNAYIKEYGDTELISRNPEADNITISEYDNIVCMGKVVGKYEE